MIGIGKYDKRNCVLRKGISVLTHVEKAKELLKQEYH